MRSHTYTYQHSHRVNTVACRSYSLSRTLGAVRYRTFQHPVHMPLAATAGNNQAVANRLCLALWEQQQSSILNCFGATAAAVLPYLCSSAADLLRGDAYLFSPPFLSLRVAMPSASTSTCAHFLYFCLPHILSMNIQRCHTRTAAFCSAVCTVLPVAQDSTHPELIDFRSSTTPVVETAPVPERAIGRCWAQPSHLLDGGTVFVVVEYSSFKNCSPRGILNDYYCCNRQRVICPKPAATKFDRRRPSVTVLKCQRWWRQRQPPKGIYLLLPWMKARRSRWRHHGRLTVLWGAVAIRAWAVVGG